jgi:hypothetical protein
LEKSREEIPRSLVHEATVGVELLVRASDEDLRLQECVRRSADGVQRIRPLHRIIARWHASAPPPIWTCPDSLTARGTRR